MMFVASFKRDPTPVGRPGWGSTWSERLNFSCCRINQDYGVSKIVEFFLVLRDHGNYFLSVGREFRRMDILNFIQVFRSKRRWLPGQIGNGRGVPLLHFY